MCPNSKSRTARWFDLAVAYKDLTRVVDASECREITLAVFELEFSCSISVYVHEFHHESYILE